ncbi:MAG TPA: hypothetical protein PK413_13175 [Thermoanaerobaculia bacterium]|nr:hypothetical protein [Thermoanaerobaculia bacterium]
MRSLGVARKLVAIGCGAVLVLGLALPSQAAPLGAGRGSAGVLGFFAEWVDELVDHLALWLDGGSRQVQPIEKEGPGWDPNGQVVHSDPGNGG